MTNGFIFLLKIGDNAANGVQLLRFFEHFFEKRFELDEVLLELGDTGDKPIAEIVLRVWKRGKG